jgi:hypothetical protein
MHLPARDADSRRIAIATTMGGLPSKLIRSITWDQGIEMARHTDITADLGAPVYFCDSRSPWQRGSNENANGLLRQYFPKGTSLSTYTPDHLRAVEYEINNRRRHTLKDRQSRRAFHRTANLTRPSTVATLISFRLPLTLPRSRSRLCLHDLLHPVRSRSVMVVAIDGPAVHSLPGDRVTHLNQRSIRRETPAGPSCEATDCTILNAMSGAAPRLSGHCERSDVQKAGKLAPERRR